MNESRIAGPANCAAAWPVITKIPAPMIAPMPSVRRLMRAQRAPQAVLGIDRLFPQLLDALFCPDDLAFHLLFNSESVNSNY